MKAPHVTRLRVGRHVLQLQCTKKPPESGFLTSLGLANYWDAAVPVTEVLTAVTPAGTVLVSVGVADVAKVFF